MNEDVGKKRGREGEYEKGRIADKRTVGEIERRKGEREAERHSRGERGGQRKINRGKERRRKCVREREKGRAQREGEKEGDRERNFMVSWFDLIACSWYLNFCSKVSGQLATDGCYSSHL